MSSINNYTLGQLIYRIIQYNEAQTRRENNSINVWRAFVNEFFAEHAIYKYCMLVSSAVGGGKQHNPFVLPARLLPRYYKALYKDSMRSSSLILDNPQEYSPAPNTFILDCSCARIISVFEEAQICTYGSLNVTFTVNLKIENWVFDAREHVEYVPYASIDARIASFMNNISAQLPANATLTNNNNTNKTNHNTNTTNNEKMEEINGEKTNNNNNSAMFLDIDCNGISSPSTDLTLDNFLNNDEDISTTNTNINNNNSSDTKTNTNKEIIQIDGISPDNNSSGKNNIKNNNGNISSDTDVLNIVRAQLQNTFKKNSPVNEFGITPQVMRCFEISDIFLSMEELMDYCLQSGCSPKSAMSQWVQTHTTFE